MQPLIHFFAFKNEGPLGGGKRGNRRNQSKPRGETRLSKHWVDATLPTHFARAGGSWNWRSRKRKGRGRILRLPRKDEHDAASDEANKEIRPVSKTGGSSSRQKLVISKV